jgi:hypothetical protein
MDLKREPQEMARGAAEEIRCLNHRTINRGSFTYPGQVAVTAEGLKEMASRLPQALQQMRAGLAELEQAEKIRMENDSAPGPHVADVNQCLEDAERAARSLQDALQGAHSTLFSMGMPWGDDEDESAPAVSGSR